MDQIHDNGAWKELKVFMKVCKRCKFETHCEDFKKHIKTCKYETYRFRCPIQIYAPEHMHDEQNNKKTK